MKSKSRGNGQGTAYRRGDTWTAQVIIGWKQPEDLTKRPIPIKRRKGGFATKREALEYCPILKSAMGKRERMTLQAVFDAWERDYSPRIGQSTLVCYRSAYKHFAPLHDIFIDMITAHDLQVCMDNCASGKRTHQNMKVVAGLIWAWAIDADVVQKDVTNNLYIGKGETVQREPLTEAEVETIRAAIGAEPYAEYIYALCYLGFRPGEFLKLRKSDYHVQDGVTFLIGGGKTEAGRNRSVPVPAQIADIVAARLAVEGTDYLFPRADGKPMSDAYFRETVFKPLMARLGIAEGKVPYSARHTYSDKLKRAHGDDKAKAALMGHTDYAFTQKKYQSTDLNDLKTIADSLE